MSREDFDAFVRRQKVQTSTALDPVKQLQEWSDYLSSLYQSMQNFMAAYIGRGDAAVSFRDLAGC